MITQEEIARRLGVSRQLVTLALRGYPHVAKASRARILAMAEKLGYQPNPHARALMRGRTGLAGLWVPDLISPHFTRVMRVLGDVAQAADYALIVSVVGTEVENLETVTRVPIDGLFVVSSREHARAFRRLKGRGFPLLSLGAHCDEKVDHINVDLLAGAVAAVRHLVSRGYRRIAHLTCRRPPENRHDGYLQVVRDAGLKPELIYYSLAGPQRAEVRRIIPEYIAAHGCPQAIFCYSDEAALGLYRGLRDLGRRIPEDVAVVGCDGIQDVEYLDTPLTTILQPVEEMCQLAWKFFRHRLDHPQAPVQAAVLVPTLVVRQSTGG